MTLSNTYEWSFDVPTGDYLFTMMDTWGDGICCEDGVPVDVYNSDWESDGGWSVWPAKRSIHHQIPNQNYKHLQEHRLHNIYHLPKYPSL